MTYPGGKGGAGVYQTIINQMPPHRVYIEPFAGSASVYRMKRPAAQSILIDKAPAGTADLGEAAAPSETAVPGALAIINGDGIAYLQNQRCSMDTLIYADPPYVRSARKSARDLYEYEMTDADHIRFLDAVRAQHCMVMISGYDSPLYAEALSDWRVVTFQAMTRRGLATECLWMNYPAPAALHDYTHLGDDYRERERIKRKAQRWAAKFEALPDLERCGILSAILAVPDLASSVSTVQESHTAANDDAAGPTANNDDARGHRQNWR